MKKNLKEWEIFEEEVAEYLDGVRQPGSGNGPIKKGDVKSSDYLVECKFTSKKDYRLSANTWDKICEEALNAGLNTLFACRSDAGDFFLGNTLDFDYDTDNVYKESKSVHIKEPFAMKLIGNMCKHSVVCWQANLNEEE